MSWDQQQRQRVEAHFEHGAMAGAYRSWHENGRLALSGAYANDRREGLWEAWYPDGTRARSQEYRGGQQHGTAKEWYPNGQLRFEEHYSEGERHGSAVAYYENGQKQSEGSFDRGAFDGTWTGWYEDGSTRKVAVYQRGTKTKEQEFPRARANDWLVGAARSAPAAAAHRLLLEIEQVADRRDAALRGEAEQLDPHARGGVGVAERAVARAVAHAELRAHVVEVVAPEPRQEAPREPLRAQHRHGRRARALTLEGAAQEGAVEARVVRHPRRAARFARASARSSRVRGARAARVRAVRRRCP